MTRGVVAEAEQIEGDVDTTERGCIPSSAALLGDVERRVDPDREIPTGGDLAALQKAAIDDENPVVSDRSWF